MRKFFTVLAALATLSLTNCGYNAIQSQDEQIKSIDQVAQQVWQTLNDAISRRKAQS